MLSYIVRSHQDNVLKNDWRFTKGNKSLFILFIIFLHLINDILVLDVVLASKIGVEEVDTQRE